MKTNIYSAYERSGNINIKTKLRELTFQILKNSISSIKALTTLHSKVADSGPLDQLSQTQLSEQLTHYRNSLASSNFETHKKILESLARIQTRVAATPNLISTAQELNSLGESIRANWDSKGVNPEELRNSLTDVLRIVDPQASSIPRVMTQEAFELRKSIVRGTPTRAVTTPKRSVPDLGLGAPGLRTSTLTAGFSPVSQKMPLSQMPISTNIQNIPNKLDLMNDGDLSKSRASVAKPKYYRIAEDGSRIEIDGPLLPSSNMGTPNKPKIGHNVSIHSPSGLSGLTSFGQSMIRPQAAHQPGFGGMTYRTPEGSQYPFKGPELSVSTPRVVTRGRGIGAGGMTPSRLITPNTPPPHYPPTSPMRIYPNSPLMTPRGLNSQSRLGERRVVYTSPTTGQKKIRILGPNEEIGVGQFGGMTSRSGMTAVEDEEIKTMIMDAKEDFSDPIEEIFDCDDCKPLYSNLFRPNQNRMF
jgi:hypothetical protein